MDKMMGESYSLDGSISAAVHNFINIACNSSTLSRSLPFPVAVCFTPESSFEPILNSFRIDFVPPVSFKDWLNPIVPAPSALCPSLRFGIRRSACLSRILSMLCAAGFLNRRVFIYSLFTRSNSFCARGWSAYHSDPGPILVWF